MSSSSVCQGLQSCLEPRLMEPRVLRLKLALQQGSSFPQPTTTTLSNPEEKPLTNHECGTKSNESSGWSFLQTLTHSSPCNNKTEDQVYVHPTVKRSSSILSAKSLEMCTESLGSETGSNAIESSNETSLFSVDTSAGLMRHTTSATTHASCDSKRVNRTLNFPPPLTTMAEFGGVRVHPRREDGRLILEAVISPAPRPYFYAERGDGRLRLCLFESFSASCDGSDLVDEQEEEEIVSENNREEEECGEEETTGAEKGELEECVDDEMGVKMMERPSRCKESGKRDIFCDGLANLSFPRFLSVSE
ncbi:hypothetical protein VNO78_17318 [Psophocarpus tetragonolobus]|uniref:FAF domain-containing protein n=1 Tax=Psophocarpus tetragonolobus TaxID=3891 RepID=A0AAN9SHU4_PSOTE